MQRFVTLQFDSGDVRYASVVVEGEGVVVTIVPSGACPPLQRRLGAKAGGALLGVLAPEEVATRRGRRPKGAA